jgi:hypothetical protein
LLKPLCKPMKFHQKYRLRSVSDSAQIGWKLATSSNGDRSRSND